jgi:hypothetical protein
MAMADTAIDFGLLTGAGAPVRAYNAGDVIFRQGDKAEELFVSKAEPSKSASAIACSTPCRNAASSARWH